ncbi:carboxylesterase Culp6 [Mycolicibacterium goodii]|uniref:Cutinase family protein n=1 Tax=Mycolicibacterium goodii TaxID=134601 RepID=A0ABS6HTX6_MYCGD|nr:cutinase family protein [Mycolicibacterium goodii]OKH68482.1 cutinase [Mycobacterium sp. SWH-M5]MBU8807732.1 cutinase family protein [Mycolicibacterium goodii]MBU8815113.1 cutinase family protein [Mycolicibacterium goodii]MBU8825144.1 cutinase family protein [Mycolicibacterium goodii]MBU8838150.1 cutinase family protein [Mycolicibacterium goodii]
MAKNARRKRHRILALIAAAAMALVVVLVVTIVVVIMRRPDTPAAPPSAEPPAGVQVPPTTRKPRPEFQSADCPDVMMVSIPGTWESSPTDDPFNPTQFPLSLMSNISKPLAEQFGPQRLQVYTVPYTAQFHNPFAADKQMSYNDSRAEGMRTTVKAMTDMNDRCPLTSYVIAGFSQGAVIAGDIASDIGNGRGPVDEDLVLGVTLIADGRREMGVGQDVGPNPVGQGAEITLHEVPALSALGLTMTGPRPGGFGALNNRTNQICGAGDLICSAPEQAFSILNLPKTLETLSGSAAGPVHALYNTPQFWVENGQTATQWTLEWARNLVENAPHPKHG